MLTYDQLVALKPAAREAYIDQIGTLMERLEEQGDLETGKVYANFYLNGPWRFFPEANAQECQQNRLPIWWEGRVTCGEVMSRSCPPNLTSIPLPNRPGFFLCLSRIPTESVAPSDEASNVQGVTDQTRLTCEAPLVVQPVSGGRFVCARRSARRDGRCPANEIQVPALGDDEEIWCTRPGNASAPRLRETDPPGRPEELRARPLPPPPLAAPAPQGGQVDATTCQPAECSAGNRSARSREYAAAGRAAENPQTRCINGGMIAEIRRSAGRRYCPITPRATFGTLTLECERGSTLCNPLIFGTRRTDPAAICASIGRSTTRSCGSLARGLGENRRKPIELLTDPANQAIAQSWNDLRDGLNAVCNPTGVIGRFHCAECAVIAQALAAANSGVRGANQCGQIAPGAVVPSGAPAGPPTHTTR